MVHACVVLGGRGVLRCWGAGCHLRLCQPHTLGLHAEDFASDRTCYYPWSLHASWSEFALYDILGQCVGRVVDKGRKGRWKLLLQISC